MIQNKDETWGRCNMVFNGKSQNPWREISLEDYENHMSLDSVMQLQTLNKMMKTQLSDYDVSTVMILGIAGGNGLEHIYKNKYKKVYGVDINENYLTKDAESLPGAELVIADLLIEYIGYDAFATVIQYIKPKHVSCIIQINTDTENWVSDSPYLHSFDGLDAVHHQMDEKNLIKIMGCKGYVHTGSTTEMLPNGKALVRVDFTKN